MNFYLDTEFVEGYTTLYGIKLKPSIDLISIGIVSENDDRLYLISNEFNLKEAWNRSEKLENSELETFWLRDNVLKPLFKDLLEMDTNSAFIASKLGISYKKTSSDFCYSNLRKLLRVHGLSNSKIKERILSFVNESIEKSFSKSSPQFYGYYCDYDLVS